MDPGIEFDCLTGQYYRAWFHFHPELAVDLGLEGYAGQLAPYGDDHIGALLSLDEKLLTALEEIEPGKLDRERYLDYHLLRSAVSIEHHELLEQDWRRRDPVRFLPVHAIHQLTARPVTDFRASLLERLKQIPSYLRGARSHLLDLPEMVPPHWVDVAGKEALGGAVYLRSLPDHPKVRLTFAGGSVLGDPLREAVSALEEYARFLQRELAPRACGTFACGRLHYDRLLQERHFLDLDADRLHAFGRELYDVTLAELEGVAGGLDGDAGSVAARIGGEHPAADVLLPAYREAMGRARAFLEDGDLVHLPDREDLRVVATPLFLRNEVPFAAYMAPTPEDPDQRGLYYVTPPDDPDRLGDHNRFAIDLTCVHEAWPGRHLQSVTAHGRRHGRDLARLLSPSSTLSEGWALYCEQLMVEQGFLDRPEHRFLMLRNRLWCALRVMLDVELHTRGRSLEEAAGRLCSLPGFSRAQAMAELTWHTREPARPMGYAVGWALIGSARDAALAQGMSLREFHDSLLGCGEIALPLVLRRCLGREACSHSMNRVFPRSGSACDAFA
jgi:uncharacterized protein (DUF885 family)